MYVSFQTCNLGINRILIQILDVEMELPSPFFGKTQVAIIVTVTLFVCLHNAKFW